MKAGVFLHIEPEDEIEVSNTLDTPSVSLGRNATIFMTRSQLSELNREIMDYLGGGDVAEKTA